MKYLLLGSSLFLLAAADRPPEPAAKGEEGACTADVFRLCSEHIPDRGRIVICLMREHARGTLSAPCRAVMDAHKGRGR